MYQILGVSLPIRKAGKTGLSQPAARKAMVSAPAFPEGTGRRDSGGFLEEVPLE